MGDLQKVRELVATLYAAPATIDPPILTYGRNIATAIVSGPANHCAATLSALLVFVGVYPNGGGTGSGDLEPWVPSLAFDLENRRGWQRINYDAVNGPAQPIQPGDVAVVIASAATHHIYLIIDPKDGRTPYIADNQGAGMHDRPLAGDLHLNYSTVSYLLRPSA